MAMELVLKEAERQRKIVALRKTGPTPRQEDKIEEDARLHMANALEALVLELKNGVQQKAATAFAIPYPPGKRGKSDFCRRFGLNAYYTGKPWPARKRDADELHLMTLAAMRRAKIPKKLFERPVKVKFHWDDGLDVDNHAVIGKCVVDAMKGYILHNDSRKWLKGVYHEMWDGGCIKVEILEEAHHDHH